MSRYFNKAVLIFWLVKSFTLFLFCEQLSAGDFKRGKGVETFTAYEPFKDRPVQLYYYIPEKGNPEKMPVLIVMHGNDRNGSALLEYWIDQAEKNQFMVFIPEFTIDIYPLRDYHEVGLFDANGNFQEETFRTPVLIDKIFEYIRDHTATGADQYTIYGHSAGGQFVQRFMLFHNSPYVKRAVISCPGWYTFPDPELDYPYGIRNISIADQKQIQEYLSKEIIFQLGVGDTIRESYLRTTPEADAQGYNRYERGQSFYKYVRELARENNWPFHWVKIETEGIGHNSGLMGQAVVDYLWKDVKRALFIGNSYTFFHDMPFMVERIADVNGHLLTCEMVTTGGYTLKRHVTDQRAETLLKQGIWDFVVLQDQSRAPALPDDLLEKDVFPAAKTLDSLRCEYNPKSKTVFYMTWGRKDGDPDAPIYVPENVSYDGMQNRLKEKYLEMTYRNNAWCAPVGMAWKRIREEYPDIELYDPDKSHPSLAGSYLAANVMYSVFFQQPYRNHYTARLNDEVARKIQATAQEVVLADRELWNIRPLAFPQKVIDHSFREPATTKYYTPGLQVSVKEAAPSYNRILSFLDSLVSCHPDKVRMEIIGTTPGGKDIPVLFFDKGNESGKIRAWMQGGLHGNEPASTEALLILMDYLLNDPAGNQMLQQVDLAVLPIANPDGYAIRERVSWDGYDLNRDQTKFADQVSVILKKAFTAWNPEVALDMHEFRPYRKEYEVLSEDGAMVAYDALFLPTGHLNVPANIRKLSVELFQPAIQNILQQNSYSSWYYFSPHLTEGQLVLSKGAKSPQSSSTSYALTNTVSFFVEVRGIGLGYEGYKRRSEVGFLAATGFLETAVKHREKIKDELQISVGSTIQKEFPVVVTAKERLITESVSFTNITTLENFTVPLPVLDALNSQPDLIRKRPAAYILPDSCDREVERLQWLGVTVDRLQNSCTLEVEKYTVTDYQESHQIWENIYPVRVETVMEVIKKDFSKGCYIIDMAQKNANVAASLLEPESSNGFVHFRVTETAIDRELPVYRLFTK